MTNPLWDGLFARHEGSRAPFLRLEDGRIVTHGELIGLAARYAHLFTEHGLAPRDRVAVQVARQPEALALYAACVQTGTVFVPIDPACAPAEVDYLVSDSGAALLVGGPAEALAGIAKRYGAQFLTLGADGTGSLAYLSAGPASYPTQPRVGIDLAALLYGADAASRPGGAMLTQANLLSNALALAGLWRFGDGDALLEVQPRPGTLAFLASVNVTLAAGGALVLPGAGDTVARVAEATVLAGRPEHYDLLLADPRFGAELCRGVRLVLCGAPMPPGTRAALHQRTGHGVREYYGSLEAGVVCAPAPDAPPAEGVGAPLPGVSVRVVADGAELPRGRTGQLQVRGPNVFQGYWGRPRRTRADLAPDGWLTTGHLARIDADGRVTLQPA